MYDSYAIKYQQKVSISPFAYMTNPLYHHNPQTCIPYGGEAPRGQRHCIGNPKGCDVGHKQRLIDLDTKLSQRNVILSKSDVGGFNDFDVSTVQMKDLRMCGNFNVPV